MTVTAVIPARYASTRLPGKPLAEIGGRPMIQWVYERVDQASLVQNVVVATDDQRIVDAVEAFGGRAVMTSAEHQSGTDRLAEVARNLDADVVVNVQGDEPLIAAEVIDACVGPMLDGGDFHVVTPCTHITTKADLVNPNVVKVVTDRAGCALYFSRAPIPFDRDAGDAGAEPRQRVFYKHLGLYVYGRDFLLTYSTLERTPLEIREKLEQLRILENGYRIRIVETQYDSIGVDSLEDLEKVRKLVHAQAGS
jgi:3-deoxy-manno-octulosonate cytidylyltransferase (CMP-KDO synthetase)